MSNKNIKALIGPVTLVLVFVAMGGGFYVAASKLLKKPSKKPPASLVQSNNSNSDNATIPTTQTPHVSQNFELENDENWFDHVNAKWFETAQIQRYSLADTEHTLFYHGNDTLPDQLKNGTPEITLKGQAILHTRSTAADSRGNTGTMYGTEVVIDGDEFRIANGGMELGSAKCLRKFAADKLK